MGGQLRLTVLDPLLFDNFIGRKRDVGGVVLASGAFVGLVLLARVGFAGLAGVLERRDTDGHVSRNSSRLVYGALERREAVWGGLSIRRMCLELVKNTADSWTFGSWGFC